MSHGVKSVKNDGRNRAFVTVNECIFETEARAARARARRASEHAKEPENDRIGEKMAP